MVENDSTHERRQDQQLSPKAQHARQLCIILAFGNSQLTTKELRQFIARAYGPEVDKELQDFLNESSEAARDGLR